MRIFRIFQRDTDALDRARRADLAADRHLKAARDNAAWAQDTLRVNNLTGRFYTNLRGGKL